ncbi:MAG: O-antigen ligase family protein [Pseudomonadota bacterium]
MSAGTASSWQDRLAFGLLLLLVAAIPWPWAAVGVTTQAAVMLLTGIGLGLSLLAPQARPWSGSTAFRLAVLGWLLWLLALGISLLPLPQPWLALLSPAAADLHGSVASLGIAPANTLSVEPAASRAYWAASAALFGVYLLAARTVSGSARRRKLLMVMALVAGAQAFYGLGMTLTGTEIGFFERKVFGRGWATGTFINRNHFAHLLALGGAASLGLLLSWRSSDPRRSGWRGSVLGAINWLMSPALVWRVLLLVLLSAVVLSQSRMGNVAFMVAMAFGVLVWTVLHDRARLLTAVLLLSSFAVADLWVVSRYYGLERVVERLDDTELETEQRAVALRDLAPLLDQYQWVGSGGGSFQSVFMAQQSETLSNRYDHAHNEYAEFTIEHGWFGLAWMLMMGALHFGHALRLLRNRKSAGTRALALAASVALSAAALHSLTDFILHIPALRFWLIILLGAVAAATASPYARPRQSPAQDDQAAFTSTSLGSSGA